MPENPKPSREENPDGLHHKWHPRKGQLACDRRPSDGIYFVLTLREDGEDPNHILACHIAARVYADMAPSSMADVSAHIINMLTALETAADKHMNIEDIVESLNHLRLSNSMVIRAFKVADELDVWLAAHTLPNLAAPPANVLCSRGVVAVSIGDICVWDNQGDGEDELTAQHCLDCYHDAIKLLWQPFSIVAPALESEQPAGDQGAPPYFAKSTHRERLLGQALGEVLKKAGVLGEGASLTGPELLCAAETYCEAAFVTTPEKSPYPFNGNGE